MSSRSPASLAACRRMKEVFAMRRNVSAGPPRIAEGSWAVCASTRLPMPVNCGRGCDESNAGSVRSIADTGAVWARRPVNSLIRNPITTMARTPARSRPTIGPICAPKSDARSTPIPRPASSPPQRCMKLGRGAGRPAGVAAGATGAAGCACEGAGVACCVGVARCLPRLLPPPKRLAASESIDAIPSESARIRNDNVFFMGKSFRELRRGYYFQLTPDGGGNAKTKNRAGPTDVEARRVRRAIPSAFLRPGLRQGEGLDREDREGGLGRIQEGPQGAAHGEGGAGVRTSRLRPVRAVAPDAKPPEGGRRKAEESEDEVARARGVRLVAQRRHVPGRDVEDVPVGEDRREGARRREDAGRFPRPEPAAVRICDPHLSVQGLRVHRPTALPLAGERLSQPP